MWGMEIRRRCELYFFLKKMRSRLILLGVDCVIIMYEK